MSIHLLGIRHHGPGSCRNVLEYLQELKPDLILLEGPAEAETLLPCALSEQMEPPVALLAYQPDQPQNAVFYPFAEFSPEWQTICYAMRNEVPLRFFDLPLTHSMALNQKTAEKEKDETPQDEPEGQKTAQEVIAETETNIQEAEISAKEQETASETEEETTDIYTKTAQRGS